MIVLAIDTALDACSVAVTDGDVVRAQLSEAMSRGQSERLAPMTREVMQAADLRFDQIDRVVVTTGPGSFTGLRVGLSFARVMALAIGKPCLGVSTLEALALEDGVDGLRGAIVQTPGAAYIALYRDGAAVLSPKGAEKAEAEAQLNAAANGEIFALRTSTIPVDAAMLALRAAHLSPEHYPPNPLYLRAALQGRSE